MHTRTGKHDMTHCVDLNSQDPNRQDLRCQAPSGHDLMRQGLSGDALSGSVPSGDALHGVEHRRVVVSQGSVVNNQGSEQVSKGDHGGRQPWHEVEAKSEIGQVQFDETLPAAAHSRIKCFQVSPHSSYRNGCFQVAHVRAQGASVEPWRDCSKAMVSSADLVAPSEAGGGRDPADSPQGEQSSEDMGGQSESGQSPQVRSADASRGSGLDADRQRDHRGLASQDLG